jgi:glycosyltransferase 2 family protein
MSNSVASDLELAIRPRGGEAKKIAVFAAKLAVTGACFWYVSRQIDLSKVWPAIPELDFRWTAFAVLVLMLEFPLVAMRWRNILAGLAALGDRMTRSAVIAVTAIGVFFGQLLPSVAGEGVRAWLLVRLGADWRTAVTSVVIDRGVGLGLLIALGFVILLLPSGFVALGGYRDAVLAGYGAMLVGGLLGLLLVPKIAPPLGRWRYSRWIASLIVDVHRVLLGRRGAVILGLGGLVHAFTIVAVWSLGRAQGLVLPLPDAAVLFTVMIGVMIVPISVGGWGLRELAVVSLLGNHGVAPEQALLFSVCFGLAVAASSLPGALAWLVYPVAPARHPTKRSGLQ